MYVMHTDTCNVFHKLIYWDIYYVYIIIFSAHLLVLSSLIYSVTLIARATQLSMAITLYKYRPIPKVSLDWNWNIFIIYAGSQSRVPKTVIYPQCLLFTICLLWPSLMIIEFHRQRHSIIKIMIYQSFI